MKPTAVRTPLKTQAYCKKKMPVLLIPVYEQKGIFQVLSLNITNSKFNNCVITSENYSEAVTLNNCIVDKHLIITTMLGLKYTIRYYQFFLISMEVGKILVY
jgi:hypothetical protein